MSFQVTTEYRDNRQGLDKSIYVLSDAVGSCRAEVWPALGFNCFRWQTTIAGRLSEALFTDPDMFDNGRPTRGGIPILFPFPNRIRDGRFSWEGKEYQLPLNDSTKKNAIHGFACRKPWRVIGSGVDDSGAWVAGEFQGSVDAPESLPFWPTDYGIRIMYRLAKDRLQIAAGVWNPDRAVMPFGLGYHPYFSVPLLSGQCESEHRLEATARSWWQLTDNLPTGQHGPADAAHDLTTPRSLAGLNLDDAYGDLPRGCATMRAASLEAPRVRLDLWASKDFRDLVIFTPPHRKAVCLEPYTCITDAVNLQARGIDAGWRSLAPGASWLGIMEMVCRGME